MLVLRQVSRGTSTGWPPAHPYPETPACCFRACSVEKSASALTGTGSPKCRWRTSVISPVRWLLRRLSWFSFAFTASSAAAKMTVKQQERQQPRQHNPDNQPARAPGYPEQVSRLQQVIICVRVEVRTQDGFSPALDKHGYNKPPPEGPDRQRRSASTRSSRHAAEPLTIRPGESSEASTENGAARLLSRL
ncbi:Uncharacterised protein [Klebsiella pneumoniae]|nr:Uncharacterised protein [Klebsiella pneumoniae]